MRAVVGLDLSLTAAGVCILPALWDHSFSGAHVTHYGTKLPANASEREKVNRMLAIARSIVEVISYKAGGAASVYFEQLAFNTFIKGSVVSVAPRVELTGIVKAKLLEQLDIAPEPVVASNARKLLCGKLPQAGGKAVAHSLIYEMGAPRDWTEDEMDAFIVANAGRHALGLPALSSG